MLKQSLEKLVGAAGNLARAAKPVATAAYGVGTAAYNAAKPVAIAVGKKISEVTNDHAPTVYAVVAPAAGLYGGLDNLPIGPGDCSGSRRCRYHGLLQLERKRVGR